MEGRLTYCMLRDELIDQRFRCRRKPDEDCVQREVGRRPCLDDDVIVDFQLFPLHQSKSRRNWWNRRGRQRGGIGHAISKVTARVGAMEYRPVVGVLRFRWDMTLGLQSAGAGLHVRRGRCVWPKLRGTSVNRGPPRNMMRKRRSGPIERVLECRVCFVAN